MTDPEYVAASFIGSAEDVLSVKQCLAAYGLLCSALLCSALLCTCRVAGNRHIKVISKIERPVAVENIDAIIEASDGLMVARGDLGVEVPAYEVRALANGCLLTRN